MTEPELPRKVMTQFGETNGFKLASELPRGKLDWEPQAEEYKPKKRKEPIPRIESLREALELFKYEADATKLDDITLEGMRVAALFRRDMNGEKFVVMFKREFYYHFSKHFMYIPDQGYGMLANHKLVYWAALEGHKIAAVFPDGRAYWIDGLKFLQYYEQYETECPNLPGEIASPLSMWERLF